MQVIINKLINKKTHHYFPTPQKKKYYYIITNLQAAPKVTTLDLYIEQVIELNILAYALLYTKNATLHLALVLFI